MTMETMKVSRQRAREIVEELLNAGAEIYRWERTIPDLSVWTYETEYRLRTLFITEDRRAEEQVRAMLQGVPQQKPPSRWYWMKRFATAWFTGVGIGTTIAFTVYALVEVL